MFVRFELDRIVYWIAKIYHYDDSEYPAITSLPRIWNFHPEFGDIFKSKLSNAFFLVQQELNENVYLQFQHIFLANQSSLHILYDDDEDR